MAPEYRLVVPVGVFLAYGSILTGDWQANDSPQVGTGDSVNLGRGAEHRSPRRAMI